MNDNAALMSPDGGNDREERPRAVTGKEADESATPEKTARLQRKLRQEKAAHEATRRELVATVRTLASLRRDLERGVGQRTQDEAHLRLLMRELTHRSKNLLAVVQAMARQTARQGGTVANFLERFGARLQALSRAHDLLVQESWHGASLEELVRAQLGHYLDRDNPQISLAGPEIRLRPEAAQSLGLALHELATNAAKYGALSRARGRVAVEWRLNPVERGGHLEIVWQESKGPKVGAPRRRGFGSMVIEHNLARALDAEVELDFLPEGLRCRIVVPVSQFSAGLRRRERFLSGRR
jgi:two-component sensor histidine kinase